MKWSVVVIASSKASSTIDRCLTSILDNGWTAPTILANPGSCLPDPSIPVTIYENSEPLDTRNNWLQAAVMAVADADAEAILIAQDNALFCRNARTWLETQLWPEDCGFITAYTATHYAERYQLWNSNHQIVEELPNMDTARDIAKRRRLTLRSIQKSPGLSHIITNNFMGDLSLIFQRSVLERVINSRQLVRDLMQPTDRIIGNTINTAGLKMYATIPSLVTHINPPSKSPSAKTVARRFARDAIVDCNPDNRTVLARQHFRGQPVHNSETAPQFAFSTFADVATIVREWSLRLPRAEISCVAGVSRSGLAPAAMLSTAMQVPLVSLESLAAGTPKELWRPDRADIPERQLQLGPGKPLILDDTVSSGRSLAEIRRAIDLDCWYAAVWVRPEPRVLDCVDFYAATHAVDHLMEWNWLSVNLTSKIMFDMDGVLCEDWFSNEYEQPAEYQNHLENASPLYLPTAPILGIVTSRLEKYREITQDWLTRHNVSYSFLEMEPAEPRRFSKHKSQHYAARQDAILFVESSPDQSAAIATATRKPVLCPAEMRCY